jgi:hypothetical protein
MRLEKVSVLLGYGHREHDCICVMFISCHMSWRYRVKFWAEEGRQNLAQSIPGLWLIEFLVAS